MLKTMLFQLITRFYNTFHPHFGCYAFLFTLFSFVIFLERMMCLPHSHGRSHSLSHTFSVNAVCVLNSKNLPFLLDYKHHRLQMMQNSSIFIRKCRKKNTENARKIFAHANVCITKICIIYILYSLRFESSSRNTNICFGIIPWKQFNHGISMLNIQTLMGHYVRSSYSYTNFIHI